MVEVRKIMRRELEQTRPRGDGRWTRMVAIGRYR